jgi:hypothetical protein
LEGRVLKESEQAGAVIIPSFIESGNADRPAALARSLVMSLRVSLREVVDEMDMLSDETTVYLNRTTGEFVPVSDEHARFAEAGDENWDELSDWERDEVPKAKEVLESDDYVALPGKFEIHEWSIMERFCHSLENHAWADELLNAIQGRGAFRYFKDTVRRLGIQDDWYRFRNEAFQEIARDWLRENEIPFVDDAGGAEEAQG